MIQYDNRHKFLGKTPRVMKITKSVNKCTNVFSKSYGLDRSEVELLSFVYGGNNMSYNAVYSPKYKTITFMYIPKHRIEDRQFRIDLFHELVHHKQLVLDFKMNFEEFIHSYNSENRLNGRTRNKYELEADEFSLILNENYEKYGDRYF